MEATAVVVFAVISTPSHTLVIEDKLLPDERGTHVRDGCAMKRPEDRDAVSKGFKDENLIQG